MTRWGLIVAEIEKRLKAITKDNGYRTDMGLAVELVGIDMDPEDDADQPDKPEGEGITLVVVPAVPGEQVGRVDKGTRMVLFDQELSITGFSRIARKPEWFAVSQKILADLKQAIFGQPFPIREFSIKQITIGSGEMMMPADQDRYAAGNMPITIRYVENLAKPWTETD